MNSLEMQRYEMPAKLFRIRLVMWLLLVSLHLITSFHRVAFNVVADLLTAEFTLTGAGLGNLAAAYTYMYVLMQIPGGMLVDRLGPRRIALLTGLAMASGSIVIALAPSSAWVFIGRLLIGFGGSVVLINIFKFQVSWFKVTEFATLSGFAVLISSSGALLAATPLALSVSLVGWRGSFLTVGVITVFISFIGWLLIRNNPGELKLQEKKAYYASPGALPAESSSAPALRDVLSLFLNRGILLPFIYNLGTFGGFFAFSSTWGVSYMVHVYGFSVADAASVMLVTHFGYMIGAPSAGLLADRLKNLKIPALILAICCLLFWLTPTVWPGGLLPGKLIYILAFILGFGGAGSILSFPMARKACPPGYTGSVTAVVNLGAFVGLAILQPLIGYVLDLGWEGLIVEGARIYPLQAYRLAFLVTLAFTFVSFSAALIYREKKQV